MSKFIQCPVCKTAEAEVLADEVDIGVGIQEHVYGYDCPNCGQLAVCSQCDAADGHHYNFCIEFDKGSVSV